ncbi:hypothetical protein D1B31_17570 [Neobacillus notoginsengisoli]|uniref:Uncharacterized protein n=1 Tax=Neobacillus notoginsengisoli TaxID=1578198 RepID=A0A417YR90_9BACI|nr:hypothetical protein D1B31_17570 [Neobacillus notoginsengisoli]
MITKWVFKSEGNLPSLFCSLDGIIEEKKKPCGKSLQGPSISHRGQKAKGEEKPEEELMGKRKSSPRLATTSRIDVVTTIISSEVLVIHAFS